MPAPTSHGGAPPLRPAHPLPSDDDIPRDLPPMDGDGDDREDEPGGLDDDEMLAEDGDDPFDDATGEEDAAPDLEDDGDGAGHGNASLLDAGDSEGLDIGGHDLVGTEGESLTGDAREDDRVYTDPLEGVGIEEGSTTALDGGEEGPEADDESLSDDGLPSLDQDDDEVLDESEFFDGDLSLGRRERAGGWSSLWERFGPPLALPPSRALVRLPAGVLSAGRELVSVDLEGGTTRPAARGLRGGEPTGAFMALGGLFVTTERGGLFVSRDGGASFVELAGWREHVRPEEAAAGLGTVGATDGLWGRTAQGSLLTSRDGERWEKADVDGFVQGLGVDADGGVVVLVRGLSASELLRRVDDGWARTAVPSELLATSASGAIVVAHGLSVAIAVEGAEVVRSLEGGVWSLVPGSRSATALAMLDPSGTLLAGLVNESEDESGAPTAAAHLTRFGVDGRPTVVAVWEEHREGEAGVTAIVVDDAHQVVWVGGGFGVAGFQPKMRP